MASRRFTPLLYRLVRLHPPDLERKILLSEVAERNDDNRSKDLRDGSIEMELLDEELDKNIVQSQADHHEQKVPEQLHAAQQDRVGKNDILIQEVPGGKTYAERHQKGKDIGGDRDDAKVDKSFVENEVIANKIKEDIQQGIRASADRVAEGLNGHQLAERGVKEID
jgi:hypothetical protein